MTLSAADRRHRRNRLLLVGMLPSLLALLVAVVLLLTLTRNELGQGATGRGEHGTARAWFAANRWVGVVEPWVAPYNEGVATLRRGDPEAAIADFLVALDVAPAHEECRVLHNVAVSLEVSGDAASSSASALTLYRDARDALGDRQCLRRTSLAPDLVRLLPSTDERLQAKIDALVRRQEERLLAEVTPREQRRLEERDEDDQRGQRQELENTNEPPPSGQGESSESDQPEPGW